MSDWQSLCTQENMQLRATVYRFLREFFYQRNVLEVESPILSEAGNTDPNIESFELQFNGSNSAGNSKRWLRTSPEFPLKRLLASGIGDCYEIGKVFRNSEFGNRHNPEFSLLEWYRVGWNYFQLMDECIELLQQVFASHNQMLDVRRVSYENLFLQAMEINPHTVSTEYLRGVVESNISINCDGLARDDFLDLLLTHCIEPQFPSYQLTVLYDFPASQCALAKIRNDEIPVAERFEIYIGGVELANGYHELTDSVQQRGRFQKDLALRELRAKTLPTVDLRLLDALESMPACAGVALGLDRLMMCLAGATTISDVISFDFSRA